MKFRELEDWELEAAIRDHDEEMDIIKKQEERK